MSIIDFVKNVGKKLGVADEETPPSAEALKKELDANKLGTDAVEVAVNGDTAVIKGAVADQAAWEKAVIAIGNSIGISKVQAEDLKIAPGQTLDAGIDLTELVKQALPAKEARFYTVKKGDNLWKIAEAVYGKGKGAKNPVIFEANKPMLKSPDKIYPGQVLRIPDLDDGAKVAQV